MVYCQVTDVQKRLANNNLGASGSAWYDDEQIQEAIDEASAMINFELDLTSDLDDSRFTPILKKICIDLVAMFVLQARHFKEKNDVEGIVNYWQNTPDFTYNHRRKLQKIRAKLRGVSKSYNIHTGRDNGV